MPTLNSHTHCQATPANATTQAWQRVCLSQCTPKPTDKQANEKEARLPNSTYPKGWVSCSKDSFVVNGSLVFQIKFCRKSPALRVAAKRYA
jgi:methionine-rich copper-binding protein CopC